MLKLFKIYFKYVCVYTSVHGYEHLSSDTHRNQKRALGPLQLELQGVVSLEVGAMT